MEKMEKSDLGSLNNPEDAARMSEIVQAQVLELVASNPDFLNIFLGLAEEAAEKNIF